MEPDTFFERELKTKSHFSTFHDFLIIKGLVSINVINIIKVKLEVNGAFFKEFSFFAERN